MEEINRSLPIPLRVVAWLFIISGLWAAMDIVVSLMNNRIIVNLGVLGIFIGAGLLRLRDGWRQCGLAFIWIGLIVLPILVFFVLSYSGPLNVEVFGQKVGDAGKGLVVVFGIPLFVLLLWERWVLSRADIKALFQRNKAAKRESV